MIMLYTDFGATGPYVGQLKAAILREYPGALIVDLMHDAPACQPKPAAYLLAALAAEFDLGTVVVGVVDPGVGSARRPVVVEVDGRWYVGPDNGLFSVVAHRGGDARCWDITWRPARLSASFHGRDLFAPVAARVALGEPPPGDIRAGRMNLPPGWPEDLAEIIYIDHYGNAMTGIRAAQILEDGVITLNGFVVRRARTFPDVPAGTAFWYENSCDLVEIAVNQGRADHVLGVRLGDIVA